MRIIIVDDDCLVAGALKTILEVNEDVEVLDIGSDGKQACQLYEKYEPDVLLMDIRMREMDGLEASEHILKRHPKANILLLTTFSDDEYIVKALRLGAKGYLLKQDYGSILPALRAVYSGQTVFGTEIVSKIPDLLQGEKEFDYSSYSINEREFEIIELIANGYSNKEIAAELFLSEGTVRNYLSTILEKLQLRDRTQVAVFYYQHRKIGKL
nr:response regulator transcription factor [uncultured Blautia sp.]